MKKLLVAAAFAIVAGAFVSAQQTYKAPRTPWGDPDLSGVYSNDDETGTPLERPAVFEGRRLEDITPAEMKKLNQERTEQFNAGVAGTEFAGGLRPPTHLIFDSFERSNSRAWLVTDPPDGKIPALTTGRAAAFAASDSEASARTRIPLVHSTAMKTWVSTIGASRAEFPIR